jgi:hypothetical protein
MEPIWKFAALLLIPSFNRFCVELKKATKKKGEDE